MSKGGVECTILAHIDTGTSALSIHNKRHLHWKALELIPSMNNEVEFSAPAHNLLKKIEAENTTHQAHKNRSASILASPQATRKKHFTKWDITMLNASQTNIITCSRVEREADDNNQKPPSSGTTKTLGLIGPPTARN